MPASQIAPSAADSLVENDAATDLERGELERGDLERFVPYLMNRIMARYNRGVEDALRPADISVPKIRALAVLASGGPRTINELAVLSVTKQSTMSRTLDQMEAAGLVRREADTGDSRVRHVHLTEAGRRAHADAWPKVETIADRMLAALTPEEREILTASLVRVLHGIRHHDY